MKSNIYYQPEQFGLELIYSDDTAGSYEFDMMLIFKHTETGRIFHAWDSGCSCPTPFESFEFKDVNNNDLDEITITNYKGYLDKMRDRGADSYEIKNVQSNFEKL